MKNIYVFFFLLFMPFSVCAQNYECFKPNEIQYFTNKGHYLRAIRIDSVKQVNATTQYYPFRCNRGDQKHTMITNNGGSWLGKYVSEDASGIYQFSNLTDTVFIKTLDTVGSQWVFYNDTFPRYYLATITSIDTMSVLGMVDSAKTILISAIDSGKVDTSDFCNGLEIILTKNHGFYQAFDIYMFPYRIPDSTFYKDFYTEMSGTVKNIHYLQNNTTKEVLEFKRTDYIEPRLDTIYDYNVGDVRQYEELPFPFYTSHFYSDTILSKTVTTGSVQYQLGSISNPTSYNVTNWAHASTSITYSGVLYASHLLPEESGNLYITLYDPVDTLWGYTSPAYTYIPLQHGGFIHYTSPVDGEGDMYKIGLGRIYHWTWDDYGEHYYYLNFLLKNGIHYGPNFPLSIDENLYQQTNIKIYPNPTSNYLYISTSLKNKHQYTVLITDMLGKTLRTYTGIPDEILLSDLPDGSYNLILYNADKVSSTHRFIVRR